jgi:hypothetical protein
MPRSHLKICLGVSILPNTIATFSYQSKHMKQKENTVGFHFVVTDAVYIFRERGAFGVDLVPDLGGPTSFRSSLIMSGKRTSSI